MNILVLTREFPPHVVGGMSYHLAHLYSEIVKAGHKVTVVAGTATDATHEATNLVHTDITVHTVKYGRFTAQHLKFPVVLWRFLRSFDTSPYDVAITHTPLPFGLSIPLVGKYHDCPQTERRYFRHEMGVLGRLGDSLVNPTRTIVDRRSLSTVDHAIFNSCLCRRAWQRHYDISPTQTVMYNGVDTELFSPRVADNSEEYVLFVGDSERKGLSRVEQYAQRGEVPVYIVGDVSDPPDQARVFKRLPPGRLADLYAGALATVHPAKFEAFGNVILESLACGTPVVTTSRCGASEILTGDCAAVDMGLHKGITHCRNLQAEDCVETAREHTWERVAEQTIGVLADVRDEVGAAR